jgi:DNA replication protein DnaC
MKAGLLFVLFGLVALSGPTLARQGNWKDASPHVAMRVTVEARLKVLTHPAVLVVDEMGYLPISRTGAMLFFQLMTRRYEHASTVGCTF